MKLVFQEYGRNLTREHFVIFGVSSVKLITLMRVRRAFVQTAVLCAAAFSANAAAIDLQGVADDDLREALRGGSLLFEQALLEKNQPSPSEVLGAAQADYKRLLAVLNNNGHFGGSVRITVNGREAASILQVEPQSSISDIRIDVDPGPKFAFGQPDQPSSPPFFNCSVPAFGGSGLS